MTCRERMLAVARQQPTDRVPIDLRGPGPWGEPPHESFRPLWDLFNGYQLDVTRGWGPREGMGQFLTLSDQVSSHTFERPSDYPGFVQRVTEVSTPAGKLTSVHLRSTEGKPGYAAKYLIETEEDAKKWLSIPTVPVEPETESFFQLVRKTGERALVTAPMYSDPMYQVNALTGSEVFAVWSVTNRGLLHEMINVAFERQKIYLKRLLSGGVKTIFYYVGPELCIPPLQSPKDFYEFVVAYDKQLIELVHEGGGLVHVHCHGGMNPVLEGFVEMGADVLDPVEPPPMGDITLAEAKRRAEGRMTLMGNLQNGWFDTLSDEEMEAVCVQAMEEGKPGGCFIYSTTSTLGTWPRANGRITRNYEIFVEVWARMCKYD